MIEWFKIAYRKAKIYRIWSFSSHAEARLQQAKLISLYRPIILRLVEQGILLDPFVPTGCCRSFAIILYARSHNSVGVRYRSLADSLEEATIFVDLPLILQCLSTCQLQQNSLPQHVQIVHNRQRSNSLSAHHVWSEIVLRIQHLVLQFWYSSIDQQENFRTLVRHVPSFVRR